MGKLTEIIENINTALNVISNTTLTYSGKKKGTIYHNTMEYNRKKLRDYKTRFENFGRVPLKKWKITIDKNNIRTNLQLLLEGTVTKEEVELYLPEVYEFDNIVSIISEDVETGFPRKK